jgi:putative PIN family toxin of toxin-antitoxin system
MIDVVFDTNVFISAFLFRGKPRYVLDLAIKGKIKLFISSDILLEICEVLEKQKFALSNHKVKLILSEIESLCALVYPDQKIIDKCRDRDDHIILECALKGNVEYIVTGDEDLLSLKTFQAIKIVNPSDFLDIMKRTND